MSQNKQFLNNILSERKTHFQFSLPLSEKTHRRSGSPGNMFSIAVEAPRSLSRDKTRSKAGEDDDRMQNTAPSL